MSYSSGHQCSFGAFRNSHLPGCPNFRRTDCQAGRLIAHCVCGGRALRKEIANPLRGNTKHLASSSAQGHLSTSARKSTHCGSGHWSWDARGDVKLMELRLAFETPALIYGQLESLQEGSGPSDAVHLQEVRGSRATLWLNTRFGSSFPLLGSSLSCPRGDYNELGSNEPPFSEVYCWEVSNPSVEQWTRLPAFILRAKPWGWRNVILSFPATLLPHHPPPHTHTHTHSFPTPHPGQSSTLAALWTCSHVDTATVLPAPCWRRLSSVACLGALTPEVLRSVRQGVPIYPLAEGSWVVGSLLMPYYEHPRSVACRRCHGFFFLFFFLFSPPPSSSSSPYPPPPPFQTTLVIFTGP